MKNYNRRPQKPKSFDRKKRKPYTGPKDTGLTVYVRDGNFDRALRTFKKKVKNANIMQDLKDREFFQTRRELRRLQKDKAIRRQKRENENNKGLGSYKRSIR
jgi:ribosomal protein S21|tara:strand:+ start:2351 stop:2656 length:306 start_codon:yes stop_codon:yes gene_type:complete